MEAHFYRGHSPIAGTAIRRSGVWRLHCRINAVIGDPRDDWGHPCSAGWNALDANGNDDATIQAETEPDTVLIRSSHSREE
ncbi:hypothetical protein ACFJIW_17385 [Tahibacter sp. UC22_41]|uniref:hypothetical protein n=1 Tax=Tahibacter sp. UC22_41 TaxID=3350178 RepID=UPI0036D7EBB1